MLTLATASPGLRLRLPFLHESKASPLQLRPPPAPEKAGGTFVMFHRVLMSMPPWLVTSVLFVLFFVVFPIFLNWTSVKPGDSTSRHLG